MAVLAETSLALTVAAIIGCVSMFVAVIGGALWLFVHGLAWLFWFVLGAVVVGGARKVLRDAVETDRRHRDV